MPDPHWDRLKEIFHVAIALVPEQRAPYLDQVCAGNASLRQAVESLIKSHGETNFVDLPAYRAAAELMTQGIGLKPGQLVAHYKIVSLIGAGGMGQVYLSEDTRLDRKVSLKFLTQALSADEQRLRRFEQEARAVSALNQPNILTIYEIGAVDGHRFIATEFIEGRTLREQMRAKLDLDEALEIAIQIASALVAAHRVRIIHRDIKPENIMIRGDDGLVKVLGFGLAKVARPVPVTAESEAATELKVETSPGVVMGTVAYMSPEQARGEVVDERTDIWSLGVAIYEMVAGCTPFAGVSANEIISAILAKAGASPLARYAHDVPPRLEEIVDKVLAKNRNERYQSAKDLLIDLQRLRQSRQLQQAKERSSSPDELAVPPSSDPSNEVKSLPTPNSSPVSSAEYIVNQVKSHKRPVLITLAGLILIIAATSFFYLRYARVAPILTDQDTILLADFENKTGDAVFDGTLKRGLAVQLGQSPFLNVFPETRIRETLTMMKHAPDERVTAELARELYERQRLKAFIVGSIAPLGTHYVITLEAVNGRDGNMLRRELAEAQSKEDVLRALSMAASQLRERLGESLSSIQKFSVPLQVTTSSLEAFRSYSLQILFTRLRADDEIQIL